MTPKAAEIVEGFRLSPRQKHLWLLQAADTRSPYRVQCAIRMEGPLRREVLSAALRKVFDRNEILRTTFQCTKGLTIPLQVVSQDGLPACPLSDLTSLGPEAQESAIRALLLEARQAAFDFQAGPLARLSLAVLTPTAHVLLVTLPALCADAATTDNLMREIEECYRAEPGAAGRSEEPLQYADIAEWQNELLEAKEREAGRAYWKDLVSDPFLPKLPIEQASSTSSKFEPEVRRLAVDGDLARRIEAVVQQHQISHPTLFLAAWCTLVGRLTGQSEFVVGLGCDGRRYAELEASLGLFARFVPLRCRLAETMPLEALLAQLAESARDAYQWQEYFDWQQTEGARELEGDRPFFPVCYDFLGASGGRSSSGLSFRIEHRYACLDRFRLKLVCARDGEGFSTELHYDASSVSGEGVQAAVLQFRTLLESIAGNPGASLGSLRTLGDDERHRLLFDFNRTDADFPRDRCLHHLFEEQATRTPDRIAAESEDAQLSYGELDARASRLAHSIHSLGARRGSDPRIGIMAERSLDMVVGILGILKSGAAYLPLDPAYPPKRLAFMLEQSGAGLVLTQKALADRVRGSAPVLCLDADGVAAPADALRAPIDAPRPESLAYVIYTSGSTGDPKGVLVTHRNAVHSTTARFRYYEHPPSRFLLLSSFAFDSSVVGLFWTLSGGGCLELPRPNLEKDPAELAGWIASRDVSHTLCLPSLHGLLLNQAEPVQLSSLEAVIVAGEACPPRLVDDHLALLPRTSLFNEYGPTEATVWSTVHRFRSGSGGRPVPIGRPITNARVYVLDSEMRPASTATQGELHIGGEGLARGYQHEPELTATKFIPDGFHGAPGSRLYKTGDLCRWLPDGNIEFLGRIDHQVKIRGYRIELAEIERTLREHPAIRDAAVVAEGDSAEGARLTAYLVSPKPEGLTASELRGFVGARLPEYMIPSAYLRVEAFPLTAHGKLDRRALSETSGTSLELASAYVAPRTATEAELARIWAEVLGIERVGVHHNFFELGGDSILSVQVVARAKAAGIRLTPQQLFQHQTIAKLAPLAGLERTVEAEQGPVSGPVPLTPIQRWLLEQELPAPDHFNQAVLLEVARPLDGGRLGRVFRKLLDHHDALRLRFVRDPAGSGWSQENAGVETGEIFGEIDLARLALDDQRRALLAAATEAQAGLDLGRGPLMRSLLFRMGTGPDRLLIAIHHLAVDGVSWRILLEDLLSGYEQLSVGDHASFPEKTSSFQSWARRLEAHAQSAELASEIPYWTRARSGATALPVDRTDGANDVASTETIEVALTEEETGALLRDVPAAYRTRIDDVLLTALVLAFKRWTGRDVLLLELEGHGREELFFDIDVSRTVGWFTTMFPVQLDLKGVAHPGEALKSIKEQLRAIPHRGIGYGLMRYLRKDDALRAEIRSLPGAEMSFNYLGQFDQALPESSPVSMAAESSGPSRSLSGRRTHLLDVNGGIGGGRLRIAWTYSRNRHERSTVERLGGHFIESLRSLISHCLAPDASAYTPSDFPMVRLDSIDLDRLFGQDRGVEDLYPLSPAQGGMLFHTLYSPSSAYFGQLGCTFEGTFDAGAFREAWARLVERHSILRTSFLWAGLEEPVQVVRRRVELSFREDDWRGSSGSEQQARLSSLLEADREQAFDVTRAPLIRLTLVRLADDAWRFLLSHNHLLLDGWSLPLLMKELISLYEELARGEEQPRGEPPQYRDFIAWLREQDAGAAESYWRDALEGFTAPTPLGPEWAHERLPAQVRCGFQRIPLSQREALEQLARRNRLTLNTVLQGVWALLLSHYSGGDDVAFGVTVSGRSAPVPGIESMLGLFINSLPLRVGLPPESQLLPWLSDLQMRQAELQRHEHTPLVKVQEWSDVARGAPLFESLLVVQNYPIDRSIEEWQSRVVIRDAGLKESSSYPLTVTVEPGPPMWMSMLYHEHRFAASRVARMLKDFETLLDRIVEKPETTLSSLKSALAETDARRRTDMKREMFLRTKPKKVELPPEEVVETSFLSEGQAAPLVIGPAAKAVDLVDWAKSARPFLEARLARHGALLFRGFHFEPERDFQRFAGALCENLFNDNGEHTRTRLSDKVYTPVFYAPEKKLLWHNENTFNHAWPSRIMFCCVRPAERGGETPIADSRRVFRDLDPRIRERFIEKKVMYVRSYGKGLGRSWQDIFQTSDEGEVAARCKQEGVVAEWKDGARLTTRCIRPAVIRHPSTGEMSWFNQAQHWHPACLDPDTRRSLFSLFPEDELPRNCLYGDGTRIEDSVMDEICGTYANLEVSFPWREKDILVLDNMLTAHARNPFQGKRELLVAMGDMKTYDEV